jgi:hypothetical protein
VDERHPKLTRHIQRRYVTLEQLTEAADAVEGLLAHKGWGVLADLLGDEISTIENALDDGPPISQAEYAYAHGRKGGLKAAKAAAELLIARATVKLEEQRQKHEQEAAGSASER